MSDDIAEKLIEFSRDETEESAIYRKITVMLVNAPNLNALIKRLLGEHFALPDALRKLELQSLYAKLDYFCQEDRSKSNTSQILPASNIVESPPIVEASAPVSTRVLTAAPTPVGVKTVQHTEAKHNEPSRNPGVLSEKRKHSITQQHSVKSNHPVKSNSLPAGSIEKMAAKKEDPPNTIRKVFRSEHPKVVLRGRDLYNKVDVTRLKIIKRRILSNSEMRYSLEDSRGDIKLYSLRSLDAISSKLEEHEHGILAKSSRKFMAPRIAERNALLKFSRLSQASLKKNAQKVNFTHDNRLMPLPLNFPGYQDFESTRCFVCRQTHPIKRLQCQTCKLTAHAWCLPENDEAAQEWVNEQHQCHYCSSFSSHEAVSIQEEFLSTFATNFLGRPVSYLVSCRSIRLKQQDSSDEAIVPTVWLKSFAPELLALAK